MAHSIEATRVARQRHAPSGARLAERRHEQMEIRDVDARDLIQVGGREVRGVVWAGIPGVRQQHEVPPVDARGGKPGRVEVGNSVYAAARRIAKVARARVDVVAQCVTPWVHGPGAAVVDPVADLGLTGMNRGIHVVAVGVIDDVSRRWSAVAAW